MTADSADRRRRVSGGRPNGAAASERNPALHIQQLTAAGQNAEAYFSFDGKQLIFQSTCEPYKCDQIFTMNIDGSNVKRINSGMATQTGLTSHLTANA